MSLNQIIKTDGVSWFQLAAPAVPTLVKWTRSEWAASLVGDTEIAGPRALRVVDKGGQTRKNEGMKDFIKAEGRYIASEEFGKYPPLWIRVGWNWSWFVRAFSNGRGTWKVSFQAYAGVPARRIDPSHFLSLLGSRPPESSSLPRSPKDPTCFRDWRLPRTDLPSRRILPLPATPTRSQSSQSTPKGFGEISERDLDQVVSRRGREIAKTTNERIYTLLL